MNHLFKLKWIAIVLLFQMVHAEMPKILSMDQVQFQDPNACRVVVDKVCQRSGLASNVYCEAFTNRSCVLLSVDAFHNASTM